MHILDYIEEDVEANLRHFVVRQMDLVWQASTSYEGNFQPILHLIGLSIECM